MIDFSISPKLEAARISALAFMEEFCIPMKESWLRTKSCAVVVVVRELGIGTRVGSMFRI